MISSLHRYRQFLEALSPSFALLHKERQAQQARVADASDLTCVLANLSTLLLPDFPALVQASEQYGTVHSGEHILPRDRFLDACCAMQGLGTLADKDLASLASMCSATCAAGVSVTNAAAVLGIAWERSWKTELEALHAG